MKADKVFTIHGHKHKRQNKIKIEGKTQNKKANLGTHNNPPLTLTLALITSHVVVEHSTEPK